MIARISGTLAYKSPVYAIVDVQGVGYRIFIPLTTFYELPDAGQPVVLNVHTHVKQDAISLFGFHTHEEREIFNLMLAVNGIGPKLAINILSGIAGSELLRAVSQGDLKRLTAIPGVGKKMAERIILELKDRVGKSLSQEVVESIKTGPKIDELRDDALSALINLGYKNQAAKDAIDRACIDVPGALTLDSILKNSLKLLAG